MPPHDPNIQVTACFDGERNRVGVVLFPISYLPFSPANYLSLSLKASIYPPQYRTRQQSYYRWHQCISQSDQEVPCKAVHYVEKSYAWRPSDYYGNDHNSYPDSASYQPYSE